MRRNENAHRERWMANFETLICAEHKEHCGKIDWNFAQHAYLNLHLTSDEAAQRYIISHLQK